MIPYDPDGHDAEELSVTSLSLKKFEFSAFRLQYPALVAHVVETMRTHASMLHAPLDAFSDLFPMLLILKKLHADEVDDSAEELRRFCVVLSGHRNQLVRHGAARAVAALTPLAQVREQALAALDAALDAYPRDTNVVHGLLCCALHLGAKAHALAKEVPIEPLAMSADLLHCYPALCSLRCPPIVIAALKVARVWRLPVTLPEESVTSSSLSSAVPMWGEAVAALRDGIDTIAHRYTPTEPLACEEPGPVRMAQVDRSDARALQALVHELLHEGEGSESVFLYRLDSHFFCCCQTWTIARRQAGWCRAPSLNTEALWRTPAMHSCACATR